MNSDLNKGIFRLADPKISVTTAAAVLVGMSPALRIGKFSIAWLAVTVLALFCVEVAKNAWGEVIDYDSGADLGVKPEDRTDFSGGKRVLVDGLLSRHQTIALAAVFGAAGIMLGVIIIAFREFSAVWFGLAGAVLVWSYHGPPLKLAYKGLGEIDVAVCYGPLMVQAVYLIQTGAVTWPVFWLSVPLGLLIAAFLWVNEFPDHDADAEAGKMNLVVRLGKNRAAVGLAAIYGAAFTIILALPWLANASILLWLGLFAFPPAIYALGKVLKHPTDFYRSDPVQPAALIAFVLYSAGVSSGVLMG